MVGAQHNIQPDTKMPNTNTKPLGVLRSCAHHLGVLQGDQNTDTAGIRVGAAEERGLGHLDLLEP